MALNINGTTGISGVDGSASAPALQGTDSNTGINFAADTVNINTGGTTRTKIDSSGNTNIINGNLGVGTESPSTLVQVRGESASHQLFSINRPASDTPALYIGNNSSNEAIIAGNNEDLIFGSDFSGTFTLRQVFRKEGDIDTYRSGNGDVFEYRRISTSLFVIDNLSNESNTRMRIRNPNGVINYNTSSDYRLKENDVKITDGIEKVKKLRPIRFKWKSGTNIYDGFLAHEVSEACPTAIDGTKDQVATADDVTKGYAANVGDPIYQAIDHSKMVPLLTAALQEAIAKIEVLETKVAALEAG